MVPMATGCCRTVRPTDYAVPVGRAFWAGYDEPMEASSQRPVRSFVPALGFDWLTPLYDPLIRLALREEAVKQRLVDQARIAPGMQVLDLGCGTGTLALLIKRSHPTARVVGLDVDP